MSQAIQPRFRVPLFAQNRDEKTRKLLTELIEEAIIYHAKINKSGKSYYVYLPRKYNKVLKRIHEERREVRVIIIPQ